jgi:hypothetical protein
MTEPDTHATPPAEPPHDTATETHSEPGHDEVGGHDDHAHGAEALGPIDTWAWGAGALGLAVAAIMIFAFVLATSGVPAG